MFEFYLNNIQVYPLFDGRSANFEQAKPDGQVFFRETFNANFFFQNDAYTIIKNASKGTEFELRIEDLEENKTRLYTFHKSDCTINPTRQYIKVQPQPKDEYKAILEGLNEEIDISKIEIPYTSFKYWTSSILQIYFAGDSKLVNYSNGDVWEIDISNPLTNSSDITQYWFNACFSYYYLLGDGHITSSSYADAIGRYDGGLNHINGSYQIRYVNSEWQILPVSNPTAPLFISNNTNSLDPTLANFEGIGGGIKTQLKRITVYARLLTDSVNVGIQTSNVFSSVDITGEPLKKRNFVLPVTLQESNFLFTENISNQYNNLPVFNPTTTPNAKTASYQYYEFQSGKIPILEKYWDNLAIWLNIDVTLKTILSDGNSINEQGQGYAFKDFLNAIIQKIDDTLTFDSSCSQFFFNALNPITGVSNFNLIVCPKIEIINAILKENELKNSYKVKLSEVLTMIEYYFKCKFYIENSKIKIEHIKYFHNGKSYNTQNIAKDLTTFIEERTGLNWSIGQDEHTYIKDDLPSQITYKQPDEVSDDFNGSPIRVLDDYVNKSNKKENSIPRFVTDIDYLLNHNLGNKSNFLLLDVNASRETFYSDVNGIMRQNGRLALFNLIPDLHIYDLPASNVEINGVATVANTTQRTLRQELTLGYQASQDFDPMELVITDLGTGEIESISKKLDNRDIKIVARIED